MKHAFSLVAFGLGANALVARDASQQCIKIVASGGASGTLGQLGDGQNRIGGNNPTGCYCLSNGGFTDSKGRGCILTPPTTQFQCDVGASPTTGFMIGGDGSITYNGSGKFYACPVNDQGEYNVYTTPAPGQTKCVEISLASGGACGSSAPACPPPTTVIVTMPAAPVATPPPKPAPMPSSSACPADLNGNYQYPHLIVPVNSASPDQAYGTQYNGKVGGGICSIFNFDIPSSYSGKTCTLVFLFPMQKDLQTSSYTTSGSGTVDVSMLKSAANQQTTYNNQPQKASHLWSGSFAPGNSYTISSGDCAAGQTVSYEICSSGDYMLEYFQDYNPSPIGLYIREC